MKTTLTSEKTREISARLSEANREFAARYPGESFGRQPVHTVYGGAHLFRADTTPRLGALALRAQPAAERARDDGDAGEHREPHRVADREVVAEDVARLDEEEVERGDGECRRDQPRPEPAVPRAAEHGGVEEDRVLRREHRLAQQRHRRGERDEQCRDRVARQERRRRPRADSRHD